MCVDDDSGCSILDAAYDGPEEPTFRFVADAAFIAASRTAVPALVARVRELEGIVQRQRAAHSEAMAGLVRRLEAATDLEREMTR